jgi:hypothetical protein
VAVESQSTLRREYSAVYDLLISACRVICPATGLHGPTTIAVVGDWIAALGACADLVALHWNPQAAPLSDSEGAIRRSGCWEPLLRACTRNDCRAYACQQRNLTK